jgi:hypothetical protein
MSSWLVKNIKWCINVCKKSGFWACERMFKHHQGDSCPWRGHWFMFLNFHFIQMSVCWPFHVPGLGNIGGFRFLPRSPLQSRPRMGNHRWVGLQQKMKRKSDHVCTEESRLLALLLLRNSLYSHKNLWSRFHDSTVFVNHFLTTGPLITWTSPYWTLNFRPKIHVLLAYLDFFLV